MSIEKVERNEKIVWLRDVDGRTFPWISKHLSDYGFGRLSIKNVAQQYHRLKAKQAIEKKKEERA